MSTECLEQTLLYDAKGASPPAPLSHENFIHEVGFYVNPSSTKNENFDQDVSLSPSPQPVVLPETQPDLPTADVLFTREVLVDGAPKSEGVNVASQSTTDTSEGVNAASTQSTTDTSNKHEFESKLSWVRRSLRRSLTNLRIRKMSDSHEPNSPPTAGNVHALRDYISKYSQYLPHQVKIEEGHSEMSYEFSVGEVFNLHFLRRSTSVEVRELGRRAATLVPLYACVEYCLLYDPDNDIEKAKGGYTFQTVGDILSKTSIPKVVCASEGFNSGNEKTSVSKHEVLMILKVKKRRFSGPPSLVVYSATTNTRKVLRGGCAGRFSTNPILTKLSMSLILKQFSPDILPCKGMMFTDGKNHCVTVDQFWLNKELTIAGLVETESVIISPAHALVNSDGGRNIYELPINCPISVSLHDASLALEELVTCANEVYSNFNPSTVELVHNESDCGVFRVSIHSGYEKEGLQWKQPAKVQHPDAAKRPIDGDDANTDQLSSLLATIKVSGRNDLALNL